MTEDDKRVEQYAMDAAQAHTELARRLVDAPLEYPLEAYRILSGLTRSAHELPQPLELLEGGIYRLRAGDRLETDFRGTSLEEKLQDFRAGLAEASEAVQAVEGLDKAYRAIGHVSYKEAAEPQP
ncbi:hypothetical protein QCN29_33785 [Streptomyces sp. HNM0663]|uniref:Uncharacterized protein n=1 Tax=Streptomyces chengmaiensis TaxID=3040919 RepID=A0ABT6HZ64_9ACTN|nr:hypothetical protein [Streptomyces chengmaiensis]MDH2393646.1 hypothetical protein [Streptomyces chengmaiensis]